MKVKPHRFCSLVFAWVMSLTKPEEREMLLIKLREEPLPWEKTEKYVPYVRPENPQSETEVSEDGAQFLSVMNQGV